MILTFSLFSFSFWDTFDSYFPHYFTSPIRSLSLISLFLFLFLTSLLFDTQAAPLPSDAHTSSSKEPQIDPLEIPDDPSALQSLAIGTACLHRGCSYRYQGEEGKGKGEEERCNYHPGVPLFHEGLKGWTCCKKR